MLRSRSRTLQGGTETDYHPDPDVLK
jgi:hypothetical protein